jgi:hypothetical protein
MSLGNCKLFGTLLMNCAILPLKASMNSSSACINSAAPTFVTYEVQGLQSPTLTLCRYFIQCRCLTFMHRYRSTVLHADLGPSPYRTVTIPSSYLELQTAQCTRPSTGRSILPGFAFCTCSGFLRLCAPVNDQPIPTRRGSRTQPGTGLALVSGSHNGLI